MMEGVLPIPQELLSDPSVSDWLKSALRDALHRDPVDAVNDAELLAAVLDERLRRFLRSRKDH